MKQSTYITVLTLASQIRSLLNQEGEMTKAEIHKEIPLSGVGGALAFLLNRKLIVRNWKGGNKTTFQIRKLS